MHSLHFLELGGGGGGVARSGGQLGMVSNKGGGKVRPLRALAGLDACTPVVEATCVRLAHAGCTCRSIALRHGAMRDDDG